ncbi:hypothetical protein ACQ4PT_042339 [Festuca glaucescens]
MDVLAAMFWAAEGAGVLRDLSVVSIAHKVSLYADDLVVFTQPSSEELDAVCTILHYFGVASGLHVNFTKSTAALIRCSPEMLAGVAPSLACPLASLPCQYLGLPLSLSLPRKRDLQAIVHKLAHWKARLLTKEGRMLTCR